MSDGTVSVLFNDSTIMLLSDQNQVKYISRIENSNKIYFEEIVQTYDLEDYPKYMN